MADIVYIDDDTSEFMALVQAEKNRITDIIFDKEIDPDTLKSANSASVWLFDFFLVAGDDSDENGLSLFQKWKVTIEDRPTTVVISGDLQKAVGQPLGPVERHHVVAQKHGVEWIGDKSEETLRRIIELADAVTIIAKGLKPSAVDGQKFGTYEADQLCFEVLGAPQQADWANSAQRQIDRARPPREVPTSSEPAMARSIIGWLLAHVLPYPSFLLTDAQAALRLGITPASFRSIAKKVEEHEKKRAYRGMFVACEYRGPLAAFLGRRWWRAGIDDLAWHLSQGNEYKVALKDLAGGNDIEWLEQSEPVLLSDADLVETDDIAEARDCVRVTDEDFPANVDPVWVRIDAAREDRQLAAKVVYEDRELLSTAA